MTDSPDATFPCSQCGAKLEFAPGTESLVCPYCGAANDIEPSIESVVEFDFHAFLARAGSESPTIERLVVKCAACAAEMTFAPDVVADECPYCGTPIVSQAASTKSIRPHALLPFAIDRKRARDLYGKWLHGLWFAPNALKKYAREEHGLDGVYVPFWTYDADTTTRYRGLRGDDYWDTVQVSVVRDGKHRTETRRVRKTRWRPASGTVRVPFDDVLVLASRSLPRDKAEALEPWDLPSLVSYDDRYLSGFRCESYQVGLEEGFERAAQIMDGTIRAAIRRDIGGDHQQINWLSTRHDDVTFKHVLLPVWISAYRFRDKVFRFLVNARTGEVQGERPWSWIKIAFAALAAAAVAGGVWLVARGG